MGLSIHYSGCIRDEREISRLTEETEDICKTLGWRHGRISDETLNGIYFNPDECEPLFLTFLAGGRTCSPVNLMMKEDFRENGLDPELLYNVSVKTQYAGIEAHIAVIKLLRYLSEKYFSSFELIDEGQYWETNDRAVLEQQFNRYNAMLDAVAGALEKLTAKPGETVASLVARIEQLLEKLSRERGI